MKILAINPGSTSTKIAVYKDKIPVFTLNIKHSVAELSRFHDAMEQFAWRKDLVTLCLKERKIDMDFDAVIGRGGLIRPITGGVYEINRQMLSDCYNAIRKHACNLGCLIAYDIAKGIPGCRAFTADPGVVDELEEVARVTGSPNMPRITIWHALNQRAIARRFALEKTEALKGKYTPYEALDLIICHLGGGISIGAHRHGRCIDVNNALDGEGPFSPERAGTLPAGDLIDLCYSGTYTKEDLKRKFCGGSGLTAHLNTNSVPDIVKRIYNGDERAKLVLDAMIYQTSKSIGAAAVALKGKQEAIILTGGMAHSEYVVSRIKEHVRFLAPVYVYPGEDEMEALALNALLALQGKLRVKDY